MSATAATANDQTATDMLSPVEVLNLIKEANAAGDVLEASVHYAKALQEGQAPAPAELTLRTTTPSSQQASSPMLDSPATSAVSTLVVESAQEQTGMYADHPIVHPMAAMTPDELITAVQVKTAVLFRERMRSKPIVAYNHRYEHCFSGAEAISLLQNILREVVAKGAEKKVDRAFATKMAQRLVLRMVFGPVPVLTQRRAAEIVGDTSAAPSKQTDNDVIQDDPTVLYRLTRDALLTQEFTPEFLARFVKWIKDGEKGVEFKNGRVLFHRLEASDCVFSEAAMADWCGANIHATEKQTRQIIKMLQDRRLVEKLPMVRCYRFL